MNNQNKVLAFLIHYADSKKLKGYLKQLSKVVWNKQNQQAYDLCIEYTKLVAPPFDLSDFMMNEDIDSKYILKLLDAESVINENLSERNINSLIEEQEELALKNALLGLKDKSASEVLRELKTLKGIRVAKPLSLANVKEQRIIDRGYEAIAPSTGIKGLDRLIKGFVSGHTITFTGDTNVGKTQVCCNFAYNVAKQGKRVLYFSLEPDIQVIEYLASIWARKRFEDVTEDDLTAPKIISDNLDIYTKEHVNTLSDMVNIVESSDRYDLVIIDHFGYFTSSGRNKTQIESNAMKTMASFSKRNKTCVLIVVHPRKSSPGKKQKNLSIQDISGSAAFSQDATDVLIVMRKKDEDDPLNLKYTNDGFIAVHKTKSGPNGACSIKFVPDSALIMEVEEYAREQAKLF